MGHKVWLKGIKNPKGGNNVIDSFTFPMLSAELTTEVVKGCGFERALRKLGDALMKKYPNAGNDGQPTIGINFGSVDFCFQLGEYPKKKEAA